MGELGFCTTHDILKSAAIRILSDITTDLGIPIWLVRLLHNKIIATIFYSLRCYLMYFDTNQLIFFIPIILIPFIFYAFLSRKWWKIMLFVQILMPLLFIFNIFLLNLQNKIFLFKSYYISLGIIGVIKFLIRTKICRLKIVRQVLNKFFFK